VGQRCLSRQQQWWFASAVGNPSRFRGCNALEHPPPSFHQGDLDDRLLQSTTGRGGLKPSSALSVGPISRPAAPAVRPPRVNSLAPACPSRAFRTRAAEASPLPVTVAAVDAAARLRRRRSRSAWAPDLDTGGQAYQQAPCPHRDRPPQEGSARPRWSQVVAVPVRVPANVVAVWSQSGDHTPASDRMTGR